MIGNIIKRAAVKVPFIRRLKNQRDEVLQQVAHLSSQLNQRDSKNGNGHASIDAEAVIERALSAMRSEYTSLPRFAFHLPLDYEKQTLPPQFDAPVWVAGETLPLPPRAERHGHAGTDAEYLSWGKYDHDIILGYIQNELPNTENLSIMDFGCSSGRVLRHFLTEMKAKNWKLTGVDVSARRIEWMRMNFPTEIQVYTGTFLPILPFESNTFDVIYGNSVFTHMKFLWDTWLLEMRRVLKPGGVLIQSIHTENAWNFFVGHNHEEWARNALGPMILEQKHLPADFVYYGDIAENQVFWKRDIAVAFWRRYLDDVTIYPPPKEYSYQDWIVGRKASVKKMHPGLDHKRTSDIDPVATVPAQDSAATHDVSQKSQRFRVEKDYSQNGEQEIILEFFSNSSRPFLPFCIDAGAYDGVVGSNSRALFLNGWKGVVIEPCPRTFARLRALYAGRPDIICVQKALSDRREDHVLMKFALGPAGTLEEDKWKYAQVSTLHDDFAASYERDHGYIYETAEVSTDTLNNVLKSIGAPKDFGFLSIDCEGEDIKIVKNLDLQTFRPLLICVESDDSSRPFFAEVLEQKNYSLHAKTVANSFFILKE